jgi:hypothetical protein
MSTTNFTAILEIFQRSVADWHISECYSTNPFEEGSLNYILYKKNQIDTEQWHQEDIIRRPDLPLETFAAVKRNIDRLNQERTDTVEWLDDFITNLYSSVPLKKNAKMNSETPAWLIDRMSILELKIYHMKEQTERIDASPEHIKVCSQKLDVLLDQRKDMSQCLNELLFDLSTGNKYVKVYRQMKMYNDKNLNPSLYKT